jgi:hypothetical protein
MLHSGRAQLLLERCHWSWGTDQKNTGITLVAVEGVAWDRPDWLEPRESHTKFHTHVFARCAELNFPGYRAKENRVGCWNQDRATIGMCASWWADENTADRRVGIGVLGNVFPQGPPVGVPRLPFHGSFANRVRPRSCGAPYAVVAERVPTRCDIVALVTQYSFALVNHNGDDRACVAAQANARRKITEPGLAINPDAALQRNFNFRERAERIEYVAIRA